MAGVDEVVQRAPSGVPLLLPSKSGRLGSVIGERALLL